MSVSIEVNDGEAVLTAFEFDVSESAEMGQVDQGAITIDDPSGVVDLISHKLVRIGEDDCTDEVLFRGFGAAEDDVRGSRKTGAGRTITLNTLDMNAKAGFKVIRGRDWRKRPVESVGERLTDLLASDFVAFHDNGFVTYPDALVDGGDFRGMRPGDLLTDLAARVGFNWFIYWDEDETQASLWFDDSNTTTAYSSTLRISNYLSDIDGTTTFEASGDTAFRRDPTNLVSGVWMPFKKGNVYRTREVTEDTYEPRDGTAPSARTKRRKRARLLADRYLRLHGTPEDRITTTVLLPSSRVNLIKAGHRIQARFSHLTTQGYSDWTWFRVLHRKPSWLFSPGGRPELPDEPLYPVQVVLSPQEDNGADVGGDCDVDLNAAHGTVSADHDRHEWDHVVGFPGGDGAFFEFDMFGGGLGNLLDGDPLTETGIRNGVVINSSNHFRSVIYSDLGAPFEVHRHLLSGNNYLDDLVHMTFESSDDASTWTPRGVSIAPITIGGNAYTEVLFTTPVTARYFSIVLDHVGVNFDGVSMDGWQIRGCE